MRWLAAVMAAGVSVLVVSCGTPPSSGSAPSDQSLCSSGYQPGDLVGRGPVMPAIARPGPGPGDPTPNRMPPPAEVRITDPAVIKKVAAAACSLPALPRDVMCTADIGPSFELHFTDSAEQKTDLVVQSFSCRALIGLGPQRQSKPLWDVMAAAGLPAPKAN